MSGRLFSLQARLFWAFTLITLLAAVLPAVFSRATLYQDRLELAGKQALAQAALIRNLLGERPDAARIDSVFTAVRDLPLRLTLTDASGRVVRDTHLTQAALAGIDNHNDRPEIEQAELEGRGTSLRYSNSLGIEAMYAAVRLPDSGTEGRAGGGILRIAVPLADIERSIRAEAWSLTVVVAGVTLFCLLLSVFITSRVRRGIAMMTDVVRSISLEKPTRRLRVVPGREFLPLAAAVNRMADGLEKSMHSLRDEQNQLETILDSMHEGVLVLDPSGAIRRCNRAMERLFPQVGTAMGRQIIEGVAVPLLQTKVEALLRGGSAQGETVHFEYPAGRSFIAHLAAPSQIDAKASLGAVIVFYDATEIMRLERVRRDFVSNVSHELRTPLTAITGCAELLRDCPDLDEDYRGFAEAIHRHASALTRVVGDLLALARIENSNERLVLENIDPGVAVREALDMCAEQVEAGSLRVEVNVPVKRVAANAMLLVQVFRNLLENACRYAPEGSAIRVEAEQRASDVLFTVADQGPGIPGHELERIFERFYQVEKERNSATAGVGLAICRHIVERHGGRIWAESPAANASTAMHFTLPLARVS